MTGRLLEYESLKSVLQYMETSTRFQISLHLPSIRSVEQMLPLKMDRLEICDCYTIINGTSYELGIVRHYPDGNTPRAIREEQLRGGSRSDFNEFGFSFRSGHNTILPGDLSFETEALGANLFDREEDEKWLRDNMRVREKALEIQNDLKSEGTTVEDYLNSLPPIAEGEFPNEEKMRTAIGTSCAHLSKLIESDKLQLVPFDCRRNNTRPPFNCYFQLTITKGEIQQIQRYEYTKELFEAQKYLNGVLFEGRPMPIRVECFDSTSLNGICRIPIGLQLQVHTARATRHSAFHRSFSLLVKNWENLDCLWMHSPELNDFQHDMVRNAKKLAICVRKEDVTVLSVDLRHLPNREISIEISGRECTPEVYFMMIRRWLSGDRQVGASFCMEMKNDTIARQILTLVQTRYREDAQRTERYSLVESSKEIIRTTSFTAEVSYIPSQEPTRNNFRNETDIMMITIVQNFA